MQRTPLMVVIVECPHLQRAVTARRNVAIDRIVSCDENDRCRSDGPVVTYPCGCPAYPSLATRG